MTAEKREIKSEVLRIRCSAAQKKSLYRKARESGLPFSLWALRKLENSK